MRYSILFCFLVLSTGLSTGLSTELRADPVTTMDQSKIQLAPTQAPTSEDSTIQPTSDQFRLKPGKPTKNLQNEVDVVPKLIEVTLGLFAILLLIGLIAFGVRRFGRLHIAAKGHLKIIGGMHLGTRERLVLIQVGEKQLLLGVTPGRIDNLHTLEESIPFEVDSVDSEDSFYSKFSAILRAK